MNRIIAELSLGARLAFAGGRRGWTRTLMATLAIAVGAAALLFGASVPAMLNAVHDRTEARNDSAPDGLDKPAGRTVVVAAVESQWRGDDIRGRLIWPDVPDAPLPPGLRAFPGDRQMYASPALRAALAGPGGDDLRRRMPYQVVGTIAPAGLTGPRELAYYAGDEAIQAQAGTTAWRVSGFGGRPPSEQPPGPSTYLFVAGLLATLLLPIAIFIGAALRFGADTRDRRLAAIRLIGADRSAVLRVALGESLVPTGLGLALGTVLYLVIRGRAADLWLFGYSVYPADVRPRPLLAALVVAAVLTLSATMALLGFRGVAVEPLGVFRDSVSWRGRLWWRLIPLAGGLYLLYPALLGTGDADDDRTGAGALLLIASLIPLLPYLVPLAASVLPGGPAAWQLAAQQLRRNPTASTRAVTGIVVAMAGTIALQSVFAAATAERTGPGATFELQARGRQTAEQMRARSALFEQVHGVHAGTVARYDLYDTTGNPYGGGVLFVGDCPALQQIAAVEKCADGDAFVTGQTGRSVTIRKDAEKPAPGPKVTIPRGARPAKLTDAADPNTPRAVLMTPAAAPASLRAAEPSFVETRIATAAPAAAVAGQLRGVAAQIDPSAFFTGPSGVDKYAPLRAALSAASAVILLILGLGLLLDVTARLHERRQLLGVLTAVGARRSTLIWSVLLQAIVPGLAGFPLAIAVGAGLGALLMRTSHVPAGFYPTAVLTPVAAGTALILATTMAVLLPAIRRVTRTEELRHE